ncbi:MAG: phosphatidate cytidylyltransferase [Anaerolineales bacterium]
MLRQRVIISILFLPLLIWLIVRGGWLYVAGVALALGLAAAEFGQLFRRVGLRPSIPLLIVGVVGLVIARFQPDAERTALLLAAIALLSMTWHLVDYERGATRSGTDFAVTLAGIFYLGWIGAYLVSLRLLPEGQWWVLTALPVVWIVDTAAYFVGKRYGKRPLSSRLSPNKTWEGYLSGVLAGTLAGAALAALFAGLGGEVDAVGGAIVGFLVATIAPAGDLGISMIKREMNAKDTGTLLFAHGGALDRIDSWLWASVLGFYAVVWAV